MPALLEGGTVSAPMSPLVDKHDDEALWDRLYNWKFLQARVCLTDKHSEDLRDAVHALADALGNNGWITHGSLGDIVALAVERLIGEAER